YCQRQGMEGTTHISFCSSSTHELADVIRAIVGATQDLGWAGTCEDASHDLSEWLDTYSSAMTCESRPATLPHHPPCTISDVWNRASEWFLWNRVRTTPQFLSREEAGRETVFFETGPEHGTPVFLV